MPNSGHSRSSASVALVLIFASLAFAWLQWVDSPLVASAASSGSSQPALALAAPPPHATPAVPPSAIAGAAATGLFEPLVTPTATTLPSSAPLPTPAPAADAGPEPTTTQVFDSGIASTYGSGDGFEGRRTACGAIFHTAVVQVAHKSLPCGTLLRIEDATTGRTVDAEVTDRGPYIPGRIVDLSWAAFSQLDARGPGLLRVNIYVLDS